MRPTATQSPVASTTPTSPPPGRGRDLLLAAALLAAVVLAYLPAIRGEFLWNDRDYVTAPHLRSAEGLARIWFEVGATEQYYPLLHSAFWLQHRLWGDRPAGYHLALVLEHGLAALLFLLILRRLQVRGAWLAAWIFALHPVMVESAGWIAEQKNTLSILFYLLAALGFLRFADSRSPRDYLWASVAFALALLSKTTTAMLPVALWAVLLWRRGWRGWTHDLPALAPWLVVGAAAGLFSGWVEKRFIGAEGGVFLLEPLQRLALSGHVTWFYLGKLVWPFDLNFVYPRWEIGTTPRDFLPTAAVLLLLGTLIWRRQRGAGPVLVAALYFGALLFPVMGFLNIYFFRFSYVGDHFQYLASLGPIALLAAALTAGFARWKPHCPRLAVPAAALLLAGLGGLTWRQSAVYVNNETLWRTTVARNPGAVMAWLNLGDVLARQDDHAGAIAAFKRALELRPDNPHAHNDIAGILMKQGRTEEAVPWLERSAALDPVGVDPVNNLGLALSALGRHEEAIASFRRAVALRFSDARAHSYLGAELALVGRTAEAIPHLETAARLAPQSTELRLQLGMLLTQTGELDRAIVRFREAAAIAPGDLVLQRTLADALAFARRGAEAIPLYEELLRRGAEDAELRANLGALHAAAGRPAEAARHLERAVTLQPESAAAHHNLAQVLAALGRLEESRRHEAEAVRLERSGRGTP